MKYLLEDQKSAVLMKKHLTVEQYGQWLENTLDYNEDIEDTPIDGWLFDDDPAILLSTSFVWIDSPQGHDYWSDIQNELDRVER